MPYNHAADSFHIKKLCSRRSSKEVQCHTRNGHFAFLTPFGVLDLEAAYNVHLRLIGKRIVHFPNPLLVITEIFSLGFTANTLRPNIDWKSPYLKGMCHFRPKFQV